MQHGADRLARGERGLDPALRIQARDPPVAEAVKEPPGQAVHGGDDGGFGADHRRQRRRESRKGRFLDGDDHRILDAERGGVVIDGDPGLVPLAPEVQNQAARPHRLQGCAAREPGYLRAAARKQGGDHAAHGAKSGNGDFHGCIRQRRRRRRH